MPDKHKSGMTILEVVIAITILLIGAGFILQSDAVSYRYRSSYEQRQQMLFYAAGQVEGLLEGQNLTTDTSFPGFRAHADTQSIDSHLQQIMVEVRPDAGSGPSPVKIYTYRVLP